MITFQKGKFNSNRILGLSSGSNVENNEVHSFQWVKREPPPTLVTPQKLCYIGVVLLSDNAI